MARVDPRDYVVLTTRQTVKKAGAREMRPTSKDKAIVKDGKRTQEDFVESVLARISPVKCKPFLHTTDEPLKARQ